MDLLADETFKEQLLKLVKECLHEALPARHTNDMLLDDAEVAKILKISKGTLPVWRNKGKGPEYIKIGSNVRYRMSDIRRFIDNQTCKP